MSKKRQHLSNGRIGIMEVRKIFNLLLEGNNHSEISRKLGISRSVVRDYKVRAASEGLKTEEVLKLSEEELSERFNSKRRGRKPKGKTKLKLENLCKELLRKGVTKLVLYEEYCGQTSVAEQISYSAFCSRIREHQKTSKLSMKQVYKGGEKYFVDFSGLTVPIYSNSGHVIFKAQIYVATLGLSNYSYVEAVSSQGMESFISATVRSLSFLGGAPECLVPDNLKSAVIKNDGYEADINKTYQELANYYGLAVLPARARKPQDKAKVETAVKLIQQRILATFRNHKFSSLSELNEKIKPLLEEFNNRIMKSYACSRRELFELVDKPVLSKLPVAPYEHCVWKKAKVHPDYHVSIQDCYYSTPHSYRGHKVDVCIREKVIEIYSGSEQIALHKRIKLAEVNDPKLKIKYRYSTNSEHMPPNHKFVNDWTRIKAINLAASIGAETKELIESIFAKHKYEPQAVRAVMSLPRLGKKYSKELFEMAAALANKKQIYSIKYLREALKLLSEQEKQSKKSIKAIPEHDNIRGEDYYH